MDAIIKYLPSPLERKPVICVENPKLTRKPITNEKLTAYVYKVINDP